MTDLWEDEGFGGAGRAPDADGEDDWDDGDESLDSALEDGFDHPSELAGEAGEEGGERGRCNAPAARAKRPPFGVCARGNPRSRIPGLNDAVRRAAHEAP